MKMSQKRVCNRATDGHMAQGILFDGLNELHLCYKDLEFGEHKMFRYYSEINIHTDRALKALSPLPDRQ